MVGQLTTLAQEVTRVSLEVGTEGKLGGQVRLESILSSLLSTREFLQKSSLALSVFTGCGAQR